MIELIAAIASAGLTPPTYIKSGAITRFSTSSKQNDKSGWVMPFADGKGAVFGDWKTGEVHNWFVDGVSSSSDYEREQAIQAAKEERDFAYSNAAFNAQELYAKLPPVESHDYLTRKGIKSDKGLRSYNSALVIPVYDVKGEIQSLQYIATDGTKRFFSGGKMQGGYYTIGTPSDMVLIAEGYATAMTLHQATGHCVVVAFNAGNLKPVCDMVRSQFSGRVIICADNDASGVGIKKASACGVEVIYPPIVGEDYNDMMQRCGIDEVRTAVVGRKQDLFISVADMMRGVKRADWIIKNVLEKGSNTLLFGESGACKSLIALDWAYCIGLGIDWHNHKTKKGTVVYIAGEGHRGLAMRMQALSQKYDGTQPDNIYFSTKSVDMLNVETVMRVSQVIDDLEIGKTPDVIFIDTLHRNMQGDENSSEDMAIFYTNIEMLAKKYNCAIVVVHHSGHGDKGRARGSSSIKAGMDAEFCMTKQSARDVTFSCTKSKDFNAGTNMEFKINVVDLEGDVFFDEDEQAQIQGVYLDYVGVQDVVKELKKGTQQCLDSLKDAIKSTQKLGGGRTLVGENEFVVSLEEWRPFAYEYITGTNNRRVFRDGVADLIKQELINNDGVYYWLK